jgi:hypothetical protein
MNVLLEVEGSCHIRMCIISKSLCKSERTVTQSYASQKYDRPPTRLAVVGIVGIIWAGPIDFPN